MDKSKGSPKSLVHCMLKPCTCMSYSILFAVVLLVGIVKVFLTQEIIKSVFAGNLWMDTVVAAAIGSVSTGNPINCYILGGEFLKSGVSLNAVTAFMLAWVTVGLVQIPFEADALGKQFAVKRNIISFFLVIIVSVCTVATVAIIQ